MVVSSLTLYMSFSKASLSIVGASSSLASSLMSLNLHHHFLHCHRLYSAIFIGVVMMPRCHCPHIVLCSGLFAWECPVTQFVNPFRVVAVSGNLIRLCSSRVFPFPHILERMAVDFLATNCTTSPSSVCPRRCPRACSVLRPSRVGSFSWCPV